MAVANKADAGPEGGALIADGPDGWRAFLGEAAAGQDWRPVVFWRGGKVRAQFGWNGARFGRPQDLARVPLQFRDLVVQVLKIGRALGGGQGQARKRKNGRADALAGAYLDRRGKWYAVARVNGRPVYLGQFPDEGSAHAAWVKAKSAGHEPGASMNVFD